MTNFTDDFTGSNGDNLESRTGWTQVDGPAGAAKINASNQLKYSTTTAASYQAPAADDENHFAQADREYIPTTASFFFPWCICLQDNVNFIGFRFINASGRKAEIFKAIGGTFTKLATQSESGVLNDTLKIERSGTDITVFKNTISYQTGTVGASELLNNNPGMRIRNETRDPIMDNWESPQATVGGPVLPIFDHHNRMMRAA